MNLDDSDDTQRKIEESRGRNANAGGGSGGGNGGGYPGGGYPGGGGYPPGVGYPGGPWPGGGGGGGGPYGRNGQSGRDTESDERLAQLVRPPSSLTFELKSPEVDLTDDHFRKLAFFTDGRKLQKPKDESYQEIAAHWDGMRLVTDEKTPEGAKMSRTFELSPDGRQFTETVHVDRGKSKGLVTIRYVFDAAGANTEVDHASDPNVPVLKRHADAGTSDSSPSQSGQSGQGQATDSDQPVLKRHDNGSNPPQ